ncbi:13768_t:CDS:1 [Acaulospora morrowiae]|uniref:13768_t:CDS:1 n=1 Tax=Acaulospora morrowiae TaxID=94023 RepID=A0A9N8ZSJ0_9GLOM|nr:13768_t:CDS:1 [Acaulospora morrowiae]
MSEPHTHQSNTLNNDVIYKLNNLYIKQDVSDHSRTLQNLIPEILECILIFLPRPDVVAPLCRQFRAIVSQSMSFKRRWLRIWLHPKLPDAFLPTYMDLCKAVNTKTPFNILMQIIDLQKLCNRPLISPRDGNVTKLFDAAFCHSERDSLIPFLISRGLNVKRYIKDHATKDFLRSSNSDDKLDKDYLSPLLIAGQKSKNFIAELAASRSFFIETDLAFAIVLYERLDVASVLAVHPQHILNILEESVDRQFTAGIAWAFRSGVGDAQKQNPLYLRLCIEKADVDSARDIINSGANINLSPSAHTDDKSSYGSTSLLEFSIQCYLQNLSNDQDNERARKDIIVLFLDSGADPNADNGRPLTLSVINHNWDLTELLLSHNANVDCDEGMAVRLATNLGYKDMAKMLYRRRSRSGSHDNQTGTVRSIVKRMSILKKIRRKSDSDAHGNDKRKKSFFDQ